MNTRFPFFGHCRAAQTRSAGYVFMTTSPEQRGFTNARSIKFVVVELGEFSYGSCAHPLRRLCECSSCLVYYVTVTLGELPPHLNGQIG